ncbi:MAG: TRAP transporter substrate-binding protein [Proteobacteria bacterium]|nr:TRAP transporter substrate-binding protein [Pseudomonadota bacterium]MBU4132526.1 TRAP transporter substrate-binding protein [Pseudomonadota bacterium]
MKRYLVLLSLLGIFFAQCIGVANCAADEKIILKSTDVHGEGYPTVEAVKFMGDLLTKWTNGRISIEVYSGGKLGGESETLEQTRLGYMDMTRVSLGPIGAYAPGLNAFNLPFVFRSVEHMHKVVDGEIGTSLLFQLEKGDLVGLCYLDSGSRSFYNKQRPIKVPSDMKGLTFRVMDNPIFVEMVEALGGKAVKLPYTQIYDSIKSGAVDGAENNPPTFWTQKHYEVTDYFSMTEHLIVPEILVFSKKKWDTLSLTDRLLVRKASFECVRKERELWQIQEKDAINKLKGVGYKIIKDVNKQPFIQATQSLREKFGAEHAELLKKIDEVK